MEVLQTLVVMAIAVCAMLLLLPLWPFSIPIMYTLFANKAPNIEDM